MRSTALLRSLFVPLLASLMLVAITTGAPHTGSAQSAESDITQTRQDIEALLSSQSDIYDQLALLEQEMEASSKAQQSYRRQIRRVNREIALTAERLRHVKRSISSEDSLYIDHLLTVARLGELRLQTKGIFDPTVTGDSRRNYLLYRVLQSDREYLESLYSQLDGYEELVSDLTTQQAKLERLHDVKREQERKYAVSLGQRERLLAALQSQQRAKLAQLADIEESADLVGDIMTELSEQGEMIYVEQERELALKMKGRLFHPVPGKVLCNFGVHRDSITNLTSKCSGIKLSAAPGAKVIAAMTGEVVYIGWARGLEKFLIADHGGKIYSLYGNLAEIDVKEGEQIIRGEPFALVNGDQLHFEVREGKTAVDPLSWLKQ